ncbi:hypothetical protein QBC33DRAFT_544999 [Phialemonium atrogriseum]|uniref:Mid2 domain-containing protein n=1 Tax=Phialemonium atrogriseum TaxID=1093897 RepID=A0AAJ0FLM5_9PEZI|nr:uncharacterized protein QBC33DRAFT_544999 [Phialemonium atrogriseum]KAK1765255.1 hypothetical protein QBC33DRAFT_544999 [Phialemonium atrogriseum]
MVVAIWNKSLLAAFLVASLGVYGLLLPAEQTFPGRLPRLDPSPAPTLAAVAIPELFGRDNSETCAYLWGSTEYGISCDAGYTCSTNPTGSVFHCCTTGSGSCFMPSACLDYTAYQSGLCSGMGASTACCSDSNTPYCTGVILVDKPSVSLVGCFSTKTYLPLYANPTEPTTTSPTITRTSITSPESTTPSPTPTPTTTSTPTPTPTPTQPTSKNSTPVGAIVGGTIGGVAVIAIIAGLIAWIIIKTRRGGGAGADQPGQAAPPTPLPPMTGGAPPYGGHASYIDPRASVAAKSPHESVYYSSSVGSPVAGSDRGSVAFGGFYPQMQAQQQAQQQPGPQPVVGAAQQGQVYDFPQHRPGLYASEMSGGTL